MKAILEKRSRIFLIAIGGLVVGFGIFAVASYIISDSNRAAETNPAWENENESELQPVSVIRSIDHSQDVESPSHLKQTSFIRSFPNPSQDIVEGFPLFYRFANPPHAPPRTAFFV
jgi:hypothetical protein